MITKYKGAISQPAKSVVSAIVASCLFSIGSASAAQIEEIIVTAQKRAESSQNVPVALTAIGSQQIENLGIQDITDVTKLSPSLTVTEGSNKQNASIRIRGIGTDVFSIGVEPSVAIVIDDISQVQPGQALANLIDIERIEVLRGPQSTLFGKNASAGLVNIVTKAPADEFEGFVELSMTDDDQEVLKGSISGPLSDNAGYRLTAYTSEKDGYIKNLATGNFVNGGESSGLRGKIFWQVSDTLDITVTAFYSEDEDDCCATTLNSSAASALFLGQVPASFIFSGITPSASNRTVSLDDEPFSKTEDKGLIFKANWDVGEHTMTYVAGYDNWSFDFTTDVDGSAFNLLGAFTGGALNGGLKQGGLTEVDFMSHELRIASPSSDSFEYLAGVYYADAETGRVFERGPGLFVANWDATTGTESMAVFGNGTWFFGDDTRLSIGGRVNREEISVTFNDKVAGTVARGNDNETEVLGKISLQHDIGKDTMLFGSITKGYKGQAYDISTGFSQAGADDPIGSESAISIELGAKGTYLNGQLQLNTVLFHTSYDDYQAQNTDVRTDGTVQLKVENVGKLETYGLEFDAIALIGENLMLNIGGAYINATIDEWPTAPCYQLQTVDCVNGIQDLAGKDLNNAPDFKFNIGGQYDIPLANKPFDGFINFNYTWQDDTLYSLAGNPATIQESYGIANLSIGIVDSNEDRYKITLFVNNLFDEDYSNNIDDGVSGLYFGTGLVTSQIKPRGSERYGGVRVRIGF